MIRLGLLSAAVCALVIGFAVSAHADEYTLASHPNGNQAPPAYGLRLDELVNATGGHDVFTFDFDAVGSDMRLSYDVASDTVRIHGTVFGGNVVNDSYIADYSGFWEVDFTYNTNVVAGNTATQYEVKDAAQTKENGNNTGSIKFVSASTTGIAKDTTFDLIDFSDNSGLFFKLAADDHRLNAGDSEKGMGFLIGRGWMGYDVTSETGSYVTSSDWLFIAKPVPEPGTIMLLSIGIAGVAATRRRRKQAVDTQDGAAE